MGHPVGDWLVAWHLGWGWSINTLCTLIYFWFWDPSFWARNFEDWESLELLLPLRPKSSGMPIARPRDKFRRGGEDEARFENSSAAATTSEKEEQEGQQPRWWWQRRKELSENGKEEEDDGGTNRLSHALAFFVLLSSHLFVFPFWCFSGFSITLLLIIVVNWMALLRERHFFVLFFFCICCGILLHY